MERFVFLICLLFAVTIFSAAEEKKQSGIAVRNEGDRSLKAAHANLAFGTRVRVINQNNHKAVIVTINRRIPAHPERIMQIGTLAADNIGIAQEQTVPVIIEVLGRKKWSEKALPDSNPAQRPPANPLPPL
jgi:rare lipoprotein A (peptidoglycan hydrolase)